MATIAYTVGEITKNKISIRQAASIGVLLLTTIAASAIIILSAAGGVVTGASEGSFNIAAVGNYTDRATLTWTAPGDDGNVGQATAYDIRYSTSNITAGNFGAAIGASSEPTPKTAGQSESFVVTSLSPNTTYYFAIKSVDEAGNWSAISNVASVTTKAVAIPPCTESWTCTSWSTCQGSTQTRSCTDQNDCGTTTNRPSTSRSCTSTQVDSVAPNTTLTSTPSASYKFPRARFTWTGNDDTTATANLTYSYRLDSNKWSAYSKTNSFIARRLKNGSHTFEVRSKDAKGNIDPSPAKITFTIALDSYIVSGIESGAGPHIRLLNLDGKILKEFFAFEQGFTGGISLATGDLADDGSDEIVVAPGPGRKTEVKVFAKNGTLVASVTPFASNYRGGALVTTGDLDGDGTAEIIVSPRSGDAKLKVFHLSSGKLSQPYPEFEAYPRYQGGVAMTAADIEADGKDEIITMPYDRGGPNTRVFGLRSGIVKAVALSVYAFNPLLRTTYSLTAADIHGDGKDEIFTTVRSSGGPHIRVLGRNRQGVMDVLSPGFFAFESTNRDGLRLSQIDLDKDGKEDLMVTRGTVGEGIINLFSFDGTNGLKLSKTIKTFPSARAIVIHAGAN